jgi:hypothetical protein
MVAAVLLLAMSCNIAHLAGVLIGETFISARYAMRKKSRKSLSAAASSFRKTLPSRPGHLAHKRW